jgi:hypothetical protein
MNKARLNASFGINVITSSSEKGECHIAKIKQLKKTNQLGRRKKKS